MKPAPPPSACLRRQAERDAAPRRISISHSAAWPIIAHRKSLPGGFTTSARRFIIPSDSIVSGMGLVSSNSIYRRTSKTARFCAADGAFATGGPRFRTDDIAGPGVPGSRSQTANASGRPAQWNLERCAYIGLRKECFKTLKLRIVLSDIRFRFTGRCVNMMSRLSCEAVAALHQQEASCDIHTTRKSTRK
jgi:hypothetical protein